MQEPTAICSRNNTADIPARKIYLSDKYFTLSLVVQHIPLFISAILARIPTNLADKAIAVTLSYFMMLGIQKLPVKSCK